MEFRKNASQRTNVQQIMQQIIDNGPITRHDLEVSATRVLEYLLRME